MQSYVGVEKVISISRMRFSRSMLEGKDPCHAALDFHLRRPADHDGHHALASSTNEADKWVGYFVKMRAAPKTGLRPDMFSKRVSGSVLKDTIGSS